MKHRFFILILMTFNSIIVFCNNLGESHFSFAANAGLNYYFVEPKGKNIISTTSWSFPSISVEYTINHLWGIGINSTSSKYNRSSGAGNTTDFSLFASLNVLNLISPYREGIGKKTGIYLYLGTGIASYYSNLLPPTYANIENTSTSVVNTLGINFEQNISKSFALMVGGQIRQYAKDDIGGLPTEKSWGSAGLIGLIGIRYKHVSKKDNVRNRNYSNICKCNY